jgi:hypothetical protein
MSRIRLPYTGWFLSLILLLLTVDIRAQEVTPQLTINMLGFQHEAGQVEWILTVGNVGNDDIHNVVITDTLPDNLGVDNVQINTGTTSIVNQTVTVVLPELKPDEVVQFSIFSTLIGSGSLVNHACISADDVSETLCVPAIAVNTLPNTGETPYWRSPLLHLSLLTVSVSLLMIGMGLFSWQIFTSDDEG